MIYHMFDTSSAPHLSQDLWLSGLSLSPTLTQKRGIVFIGDPPLPLRRRHVRCRSLIICGRLITVDDAGVGGGAGGRAECRVMMY